MRSIYERVSKWTVTRKHLYKIWDNGSRLSQISGTFILAKFNAILELFSALFSTLARNSQIADQRMQWADIFNPGVHVQHISVTPEPVVFQLILGQLVDFFIYFGREN